MLQSLRVALDMHFEIKDRFPILQINQLGNGMQLNLKRSQAFEIETLEWRLGLDGRYELPHRIFITI